MKVSVRLIPYEDRRSLFDISYPFELCVNYSDRDHATYRLSLDEVRELSESLMKVALIVARENQ